MLMFEDEELGEYLKDENVGYGDKLERLVSILGGDKTSVINRIKAKTSLTHSSLELFEGVLRVLDVDNQMAGLPHRERMLRCRGMLPHTPPTLTGGNLSTDMKVESYGLIGELDTLVSYLGVVHTGYILDMLVKG